MRKSTTMIGLGIGGILILLGALLLVIVMSANQWNFMKLSNVSYETNTYELEDDFENILIKGNTADIQFLKSEDGKTKVVCHENAKTPHLTQIKDGTLFIEITDNRKWYEHLSIFNFDHTKITVCLPEGTYGDLNIKTTTGNVTLPKEFTFENVSTRVSTGSIACSSSATNLLQLRTSTGKISISDLTAGRIDLASTTGGMIASKITCTGEMRAEVTSGGAIFTDIACKSLLSEGDTGNLTLKNVIAEAKFDIERSTGNVKMEKCDAAELFIETDTGSVKGSLLTKKIFLVETDTGSIDVPKSVSGGRCEIETDTGNIKITVG